MHNSFWNDYFNWGLMIWFGFVFLMFSTALEGVGSPHREAFDRNVDRRLTRRAIEVVPRSS